MTGVPNPPTETLRNFIAAAYSRDVKPVECEEAMAAFGVLLALVESLEKALNASQTKLDALTEALRRVCDFGDRAAVGIAEEALGERCPACGWRTPDCNCIEVAAVALPEETK